MKLQESLAKRTLQIDLETCSPEHAYAVKMQSHLRDVLQKYEASLCVSVLFLGALLLFKQSPELF